MLTLPELAWVVPVIIPLIIGVLVGVIVKHTVRLLFAIAALVLVLVLFGAVSLPSQDIVNQVLNLLPRIIGTVSGVAERLPYSSLTFLLGVVLGWWKG